MTTRTRSGGRTSPADAPGPGVRTTASWAPVAYQDRPVPLASLQLDPALQQRAGGTDAEYVAELAAALAAGKELPPVVVFESWDDVRWLADGFNRVEACRVAGKSSIPARVYQGGRRDALRFSLSANAAHGLRRTAADKRKSVLTALSDPEWRDLSGRDLADLCGVSDRFVNDLRRGLTGAAPDPVKSAAGRAGNAAKADARRSPGEPRASADGPHPDAGPAPVPYVPPPPPSAADTAADIVKLLARLRDRFSELMTGADAAALDADARAAGLAFEWTGEERTESAGALFGRIAVGRRLSCDELDRLTEFVVAVAAGAKRPAVVAGPWERPPDPADGFVKRVNDACRHLDAGKAMITALADSPLADSPLAHSLRWQSAAAQIEAARKTLWQGRPTEPCPYCPADAPADDCRACRGTGRASRAVAAAAPKADAA